MFALPADATDASADLLAQFLDYVRHQPCTHCQAWPSDPAHVTARGSAHRTAHLGNVLPLCRVCHRLWDDGRLPHLTKTDASIIAQHVLQRWLNTRPTSLPF